MLAMIVKCSQPHFWYADMIGEEVDVCLSISTDRYILLEGMDTLIHKQFHKPDLEIL